MNKIEWRIDTCDKGWKLTPVDFYKNENAKKWFNRHYSIEFTALDNAKDWIKSNRAKFMYKEMVNQFKKDNNLL